VTELLAKYDALDRGLVAAGFPRTSPWWRATIERFLCSGRRRLVARVGRRGGKSSTLCRLAVLLALYGAWTIPPGDVGVVAFVSVSRDEASQRLRTIEAVLRAIGVKFKPIESGIELVGRPVAFKVYACSVAAVSGPTCIAIVADEVAKWRDSDSGANPATEVLAALRPTTATQPNAIEILSSSPLGNEDAHARAFDEGDTATQIVASAPTWLANPSVTEAATRGLEPDDRVWRREYAAIPQASALGAFDDEAVARAFRPVPRIIRTARRAGILDPSSGRSDAWAYGFAGWSLPMADPTRAELVVDAVASVTGRFWQQISGDAIVDAVVAEARKREVGVVHADQREALMLSSAFERRHLPYCVHDWTNAGKIEAVTRLRRWFADDRIVLPDCPPLRRELARFEERITSSGALTYAGRREHDDHVALLLTLAMVDAARELPSASYPSNAPASSEPTPQDRNNFDDWSGGSARSGRW